MLEAEQTVPVSGAAPTRVVLHNLPTRKKNTFVLEFKSIKSSTLWCGFFFHYFSHKSCCTFVRIQFPKDLTQTKHRCDPEVLRDGK